MEVDYANNIILTAKREAELNFMLKRYKKYIEEKELTLNFDKFKIIVFEKTRGKRKTRKWKWE